MYKVLKVSICTFQYYTHLRAAHRGTDDGDEDKFAGALLTELLHTPYTVCHIFSKLLSIF